MLIAPGFSGGWKATKVEVAQSGEIDYVTGTWEFNSNDASGKLAQAMETFSKYSRSSLQAVDVREGHLELDASTIDTATHSKVEVELV